MVIDANGNIEIDEFKAKRMIDRIIKLEKSNLQTKHDTDVRIIEKIKGIIREEENSVC